MVLRKFHNDGTLKSLKRFLNGATKKFLNNGTKKVS